MSAQAVSTDHRLDKTLFWLRWLLLGGVALLALLAEDLVLGGAPLDQTKLLIALGVGVAGNLFLGLLAFGSGLNERALGVAGVAVDSVLAALFFWAYDGAVAALIVLGTLAVVAAAYRFGWRGIGGAVLALAGGSLVALLSLGDVDGARLASWGLSAVFLGGFGALGAALRAGGRNGESDASWEERENEAQKLRATRERARAIFEMANALSASLDHRRVLEEAQKIGLLGLRDQLGENVHLVSAVLLFQGDDNQLRVVTSRGLTRADTGVAVPGRQGVLGLALKQAEPVFAGDPARDPELRYFASFQDAKSVLAIPLRAGYEVYGAMVFGCDQPNAFSDDHVELMNAIGTQSTLSLQNAVLYQNLLTEKERIVEVEEDARKKLSRDLHDGPTQSVAAIAMRVNYIRRLIERQPQQATEELWKVEELARRTTKEIRHMLFTLRPLVLETQGLLAALAQLADKMRDTHDTNVVLKAQPDVDKHLDTNQQGVLFYIVEEAVNNARKHAQSEAIWVRLYRREGFVVIEIEDNGVGFDVGAVDASYDQRGSLGMVNMRERAELIEGTLRIQSAKGRGTKISVLVPVSAAGVVGETGEGAEPAPPLELRSHRAGAQQAAAPESPAAISRPKPPASRPPDLAPAQASRPATGPVPQPSPTQPAPRPGTTTPLPRVPTTGPVQPGVAPAAPDAARPRRPITGIRQARRPGGSAPAPEPPAAISRPKPPAGTQAGPTQPSRPVTGPAEPKAPQPDGPEASPTQESSE